MQLPAKMRLDIAVDVNYAIVSKVALFQVGHMTRTSLNLCRLLVFTSAITFAPPAMFCTARAFCDRFSTRKQNKKSREVQSVGEATTTTVNKVRKQLIS